MVKILSLFLIDFRTTLRYRLDLFSWIFMMFTVIMPVIPIIFSGNINADYLRDNYLVFLAISTTYWCYIEDFWSALFTLRSQMKEGILEQMLLLPINSFQYLFGQAMKGLIFTSFNIIPFILVVAVILFNTISFYEFLIIISVFIISIIANYGLCLCFFGLGLLITEIDQIISLLGNIAPFICGLFLPLKELPVFFSLLGYIFPFTWALDIMRYLALDTPLLYEYNSELLIFVLISVLYIFGGNKIYKVLLKKARKQGFTRI